jgi:hypothetical protein
VVWLEHTQYCPSRRSGLSGTFPLRFRNLERLFFNDNPLIFFGRAWGFPLGSCFLLKVNSRRHVVSFLLFLSPRQPLSLLQTFSESNFH